MSPDGVQLADKLPLRSGEILLAARGLGRRGRGAWLLEDASLELRAGDRVALVGPSGSGKTLLLRSLVLLDPLDAGEIEWRGSSVRGNETPRLRSRVIYLMQRPDQSEGTVEDHLRIPFTMSAHRKRRFHRQRVVELLESLGRDATFLEKQQRELSGGEAQIVALLRVIQLDPEVLLLDEPTAALDAATSRQVETLVRAWFDDEPTGRALIWVSHDAEQSRRISNRMIRIESGRLENQ